MADPPLLIFIEKVFPDKPDDKRKLWFQKLSDEEFDTIELLRSASDAAWTNLPLPLAIKDVLRQAVTAPGSGPIPPTTPQIPQSPPQAGIPSPSLSSHPPLHWPANPDEHRKALMTWKSLDEKDFFEFYKIVGEWGFQVYTNTREPIPRSQVMKTLYEAANNKSARFSIRYYVERIQNERKETSRVKSRVGDLLTQLRAVAKKVPFKQIELDRILGHETQEDEQLEGSGQTISQLENELSKDSNKILIFGNLKAGKSLLINTLLGHPYYVVPTSPARCTARMCEIVHAVPSAEKIVVNHSSGLKDTFSRGGMEGKWQDKLDEILASEEKRAAVMPSPLTYHFPAPLLECGIELVDSPGLNENERLDEQVRAYLPNAMSLLIVISAADGAITESLGKLLSDFAAQPNFDPRRLLFVVTHRDTIRKKEEWDKIEAVMIRGIRTIFPKLRRPLLVAIDLRSAFDAQCLGIVTIDMAQLYKTIIAHIINGRKLSLLQTYHNMTNFLDLVHKPVKVFLMVKDMVKKTPVIEKKIQEYEATIKRFKKKKSELEAGVKKIWEPLLTPAVALLKADTIADQAIHYFGFSNIRTVNDAEKTIVIAVQKAVRSILEEHPGFENELQQQKTNLDSYFTKFSDELKKEEDLLNKSEGQISFRAKFAQQEPRDWFESAETALIWTSVIGGLLLAPVTLIGLIGVGMFFGAEAIKDKIAEKNREETRNQFITKNAEYYKVTTLRVAQQWPSTSSPQLKDLIRKLLMVDEGRSRLKARIKSAIEACGYSVRLLKHVSENWNQYEKQNTKEYIQMDNELTSISHKLISNGFACNPSALLFPFLDIHNSKYNDNPIDIVYHNWDTLELPKDYITTVYLYAEKCEDMLGYDIKLSDSSMAITFVFKKAGTGCSSTWAEICGSFRPNDPSTHSFFYTSIN